MEKAMEREQMFLEMLYEKNTIINNLVEELKKIKEEVKKLKEAAETKE